jgi:MoxR-like ATPase
MQKVAPSELIDILTPIYAAGISVPTVMLWGQPGVGKSEAVKELAEQLQKVTKKDVIVTDVRLLLYNPIDLRGIPYPDKEKEVAKWFKPEIFKLDADPNVINIILLDELSAAPQSVQAAAYQLTLDKKIGEHVLPDNVIIIGAGNRVQDRGVAYKMPTPLSNRMSHFEVIPNIEDWKRWADRKNQNEKTPELYKINPHVIGFLSYFSNKLSIFDPNTEDNAFPSPRTWEFVSRYMNIYQTVAAAEKMIVATIGNHTAQEFKAYVEMYENMPDIDGILAGKPVKLDNDALPDYICALSAALVNRARTCTDEQLDNIVNFILDVKLHNEYIVMTVRDLRRIPRVDRKLKQSAKYPEWFSHVEKFL